MFRRAWQAGLIGMATSKTMKATMQNWSSSSQLATRYVGGATPENAVEEAESLADRDVRSSMFYLGEYVDTQELVDLNMRNKKEVIDALATTDLDRHVSVDPTQIGFSIDRKLGKENAIILAEAVADASRGRSSGVDCLMLDMEDSTVTNDTIALHDHLHDAGLPVAQTLQAYLRRTPSDMDAKIRQGAKVRLVKGAFAAGKDIAFSRHEEIKAAYRSVARQMLSAKARDHGFYPIFATHDHTLHAEIVEQADAAGWKPDEYEFEMLYGARPDVTEELAKAGQRVRLYLPFGEDWWPYAVRRIAENPNSALMLGRAMLTRH